VKKMITRLPLSLRWQMVLWYTTTFTVLLLLTGAIFYHYLESSLEASVDTDLQLRAQQVAAGAVISHGQISLRNVTGDLPGFGTQSQNLTAQPSDANYGVLVRLLDAQGKLIAETPAFQELSVPTASITQPLVGTPWQGTIKAQHDQEVRIDSRTLDFQGKTVAILQVGSSLTHLHTLLHQLVAALLLVGLLVLICCSASSYWLASRSFAPIQRLAETARKIKAGDLHQRVPVPVVRDEVQYLATTFNEMLDALEQSFFRQRQFVSDASHELRTPVAVIRNTAGVALLEPPQLDETITALQEIRSETERLTVLLTDLLTLARGDEGQSRFEREVIQLDRMVETVAATTEILATERRIQLSVQVCHPVTMVGDEARLIQVVLNLLDNAIRYTNPGGQIQVTVEQTENAARLLVRDTGIGIAPEHLPHIFERFYRADSVRQQTGGNSSGLGLSIVEWIVRMHGGSVDVESQVGQGSCFTITLPKLSLMPPASNTSL
jgi:two-component system OmpR family sensor kinase